MELGIRDLRVLITAGASGIGYSAAEAFLQEGARVYICDVDEAALAAASRAHPELMTIRCDVSDREAVARMFEDAVSKLGGLDCLINNAGVSGPTGPVDGERARRVIHEKAALAGKTFDEIKANWPAMASIKELIDPRHLADMMVYLASSRARTISGQAISIDGDMQALV